MSLNHEQIEVLRTFDLSQPVSAEDRDSDFIEGAGRFDYLALTIKHRRIPWDTVVERHTAFITEFIEQAVGRSESFRRGVQNEFHQLPAPLAKDVLEIFNAVKDSILVNPPTL